MSADQREAVLVLADGLHGNSPSLYAVALLTIRAHLPAVEVGMAIGALPANIAEHKAGVTLTTGNALVHSTQRVFRLIMVEFRTASDRLPRRVGMAAFARLVQVAMWTLHLRMRLSLLCRQQGQQRQGRDRYRFERGTHGSLAPLSCSGRKLDAPDLHIRTGVARRASYGRRFVEQNILAIHRPHCHMTRVAPDVLVSTLEWEIGLLMVKKGRSPLRAVMAIRTVSGIASARKLLAVGVFVALFAHRRRSAKIHMLQVTLEIRWPVAALAIGGTVRPDQGELRARMIEFADVSPGGCVVAGFAARGTTVRYNSHAYCKFIAMRVLVTSRAGEIAEVVAGLGGIGSIQRLMAVATSSRNVRPGQCERSLLMPRQRKSTYVEVVLRMAQFAAIKVGSARELLLMGILVAITALRKLNLELGGATGRNMAFGAFH